MGAIAFIIHGRLRRKKQLYRMLDSISRTLYDNYFYYETKYSGHATELASLAVRNGCDHIITIGGDGTLNETLNGMVNACTEPGSDLPDFERLSLFTLGVIPTGTGNDFARTMNIPKGFNNFPRILERYHTRLIDIGKVTYTDTHGKSTIRYFLNITDCGIGGLTARKVNESSKWLGSDLTFLKAITLSFIGYRKPRVRCVAGEWQWEAPLLSLVVANGQYFGSGLKIAPEASPDDGLFDVVTIGDVSLWDYLRSIGKVRRGEKLDHPQVSYHRFRTLSIESLEGDCEIDMDGEYIGNVPATFECIPGAIRFLSG